MKGLILELKLSIEDKQFDFFINLIKNLQNVVKDYEIIEDSRVPNKETLKAIKESENGEGEVFSLNKIVEKSKEKLI